MGLVGMSRHGSMKLMPGPAMYLKCTAPLNNLEKKIKQIRITCRREGRKESALDRRNERRGRQSLHACQTSLTLTEPVSTVVQQHAMLQAAYGGRRDRRVQDCAACVQLARSRDGVSIKSFLYSCFFSCIPLPRRNRGKR